MHVVKSAATSARIAIKNPGAVLESREKGERLRCRAVNSIAKAGPSVKPTMAVIPFSSNARLRVLRLT